MTIQKIQAGTNYVIVKPDKDFETYVINGRDTGLIIGDAADSKDLTSDKYRGDATEHKTSTGQTKAVTGTVISVCKQATYNHQEIRVARSNFTQSEPSTLKKIADLREYSLQYDVPIEIKEGDKVIFDYVAHYECYQSGKWIEIDGEDCFILKYDQLYARYTKEDGSDIYPLNGKLFVQALEREKETKVGNIVLVHLEDNRSFDTVDYLKGKKIQLGQVVVSGCLVKGYIDDPGIVDDESIGNGDYIAFKWAYATPFQSEMHQRFFPNKKIMVLNRKDVILGIPNIETVKQIKI